jgi:hypothetical protein
MGRQQLEIEVKALYKRIQSQKSQRSDAWNTWNCKIKEQAALEEKGSSVKEITKEISSISGLISSLNYSIMGSQREYTEKCTLLIQYIVE